MARTTAVNDRQEASREMDAILEKVEAKILSSGLIELINIEEYYIKIVSPVLNMRINALNTQYFPNKEDEGRANTIINNINDTLSEARQINIRIPGEIISQQIFILHEKRFKKYN